MYLKDLNKLYKNKATVQSDFFLSSALIASFLVLVVGIIALSGWIIDVRYLRSFLPGHVEMKVNTAISFIFIGLGLAFHILLGSKSFIPKILGLPAGVLSALTLIQYIFNIDFGIDQLIIAELPGATYTTQLGRMAPNTAVAFCLTSIVLIFNTPKKQFNFSSILLLVFSSIITGVGLLALIENISGLPGNFGWWDYTRMAFPTASAVLLIGIVLFFIVCRDSNIRWQLERKYITRFVLGSLILIITISFSFQGTLDLVKSNTRANSEQTKISKLKDIRVNLSNARLNEFDYYISGKESSFNNFNIAVNNVKRNFSELKELDTSHPEELIVMNLLEPELKQEITLLNNRMKLLKDKLIKTNADIFFIDKNEIRTHKINKLIDELLNKKNESLVYENRQTLKFKNEILLIIPVGTVMIFVLLGFVFFSLNREISERRQTETLLLKTRDELETRVKERTAKLALATAEKDKFFSIIAHDLKGPFQSLLGISGIIIEESDSLERKEIISYNNDLNELLLNQYELLENLLKWGQIQRGMIEFYPESISIKDKVDKIFELFKAAANNKKIELVNYVPDNYIIICDKNMLYSIFQNLIYNAIKFTFPNGKVEIGASETNEFIKVSVSDTGIGINEENIDELFRLDKLLSSPGTASEKGTGLGLILCKEMIEKYGGAIWVESKISKGTTFYFTIPKIFDPKRMTELD